MTIDLITIIAASAVLLLALITPMMSPFFRRPRQESGDSATDLPPVTVLLVSNGDHTALDEHLPLYLTQEYAPGYHIVVVTEKADLETENVLKRYSNNERLYHTFVPESSRYMSKSKLAITLGVKAAKEEWIVLTDPRCKPADSHWLAALATRFTTHSNLVLGYSNYADESPRLHRFERLHTALYLLREAQKGRAYATNCQYVAFRKSQYMENHGYLEYLKYSIGEYDFLVDKYAPMGHTEVALDPPTRLIENPISDKSWQNKQVYAHEVARHLERGGTARVLHGLDQCALHLNYLLILATGIFAGLTSRWILLGACVAALCITLALRILIGKKALADYQVDIPAWRIIPLEIGMLRHNILTRMRYEYADKNDFISHKV